MAAIPQRELRNDVGGVLRRAEAGEHIVITVAGRPVAELGPVRQARAVSGRDVQAKLNHLPRTSGLLDDLRSAGGGLPDPFE